MAVKNFSLGKAELVVRWLVLKQHSLSILTQLWPTFWTQKAEINNSFNSIYDLKTDQLKWNSWKKNNSFLPFLTLMSFNCFISSYICLKFPLRCLYNHYLSFKRYSACKIGKKAIDNARFFTFFTTLDLTWPQFWPRTTRNLIFFVGF